MTRLGIGLCIGAAVAAPLLGGGVHRVTIALLLCGTGVGVALLLAGSELEGRGLRVGLVVAVPLVFLAIPLLQSVPLPGTMRRLMDPKGTALLADNAVAPARMWPLSLDPPNTRVHIGKAAAALVVFLAAYHLASGQSRRHLVPRAIAAAGIATVAVGIGHRILGVDKIYGMLVSTERTLLTGPFVNSNHTAELLEIAAFACLGCSFQRRTALNRVGWMIGMLLCIGGAAATLSRGSVLGTVAGISMFAFLRYVVVDQQPAPRRRISLAWAALLLGLVVLAAGALGAGQLVDRFHVSAVTNDGRFRVWRDSLRVLAAHPMGIGRGAFDRVFPVYRTIRTPLAVRFAFVENQPLQILIDSGWLFSAAVLAALGFAALQLVRWGRRERTDAALIAGLFAVAIHSFVDFGLETLGVLLPFMAILGTVLGRTTGARERSVAHGRYVVAIACGGLVIGMISVAHASYDDFDAMLKKSANDSDRRELLLHAQTAHPIDYYYALAFSRLEPLKSPAGGPSPRFHALNRALALCPACETVHADVARNLWRMGLHRQSLLEWRTAVNLQPKLFVPALGELFGQGATPLELASVAASDPPRMIEVANFLASVSRIDAAVTVLDQAEAVGAPLGNVLLLRAKLQLRSGGIAAAQATVAKAHAAGVRDSRLALLDAQLGLETTGAHGADQALAVLDAAAAQDPWDLDVQRMRLDIVTRFGKWQAADGSLEGFKQALYHDRGSATEAHIASARILARLSRWNNALSEYRIALADDGSNVSLWLEFGRAAESAGRVPTARDAYAEAARLSPRNPEVASALRALDEARAKDVATGILRGMGAP